MHLLLSWQIRRGAIYNQLLYLFTFYKSFMCTQISMCRQISTQIKIHLQVEKQTPWSQSFPSCVLFISLYALPPQLLSYLSLLFSHQLCITTFCYNLSDYIRALQWEAARKGEMQKSEGLCNIVFYLLHFYFYLLSLLYKPDALCYCPHSDEGDTKFKVYSTVNNI